MPQALWISHEGSSTWVNIDNSKRTIQWFRFTKAFRDKKGTGSFTDYQIYRLLSTKVPEEKLALVFESLKQIPDLKSLAETMQNYQIRLWVSSREDPSSIRTLLGVPHSSIMTAERGPRDDIIDAFTKIYSGGS
ncbi:hypothetical protein PHYSODRAFT_250186 [Phytophthora sojae]|uniref:RXLR phytopathogen effector protein WY-domain domain-containing protein n=1 Tax=Phytophthora sojae (strain P6497) TaxID=1094619 RepID=G4ZLN9_PHYSP|nr:hypothetical protein PHYSODRAFT_250186 [Phytophthora sojae]EGZ14932.1 hypothetical protein PHYSODRAFT_250186 [Phytophthora sojae]|eukprot:XP_009528681.1 hypothetical protein PHYSODRAFT_250186 [Phytophthora sojae]